MHKATLDLRREVSIGTDQHDRRTAIRSGEHPAGIREGRRWRACMLAQKAQAKLCSSICRYIKMAEVALPGKLVSSSERTLQRFQVVVIGVEHRSAISGNASAHLVKNASANHRRLTNGDKHNQQTDAHTRH